MIDVDHDHLGRAPRRAARLDGAGRAIADLEERHQAGRLAAARQLLARAADAGEVRAGARAVLEEPRLADPQVHDAAFAHQLVGHALDEAGMRLRPLVGGFGRMRRAVAMVDIPVALARPVDAVGPVQAGVEPLRRVGCRHLRRQHEAVLVVEGEGVGLAVEVAALPAPVGPGAGHAMEDVARAGLAAEALVGRQRGERRFVRHRTPQPLGHVGFGDLLQAPATPARRKYFCAITSVATCDQAAGTSMPRCWKTIVPSGLRISELPARNAIPSNGDSPARVNRRSKRIFGPPCPVPVNSFDRGVLSMNARASTYGHTTILNYKILCAQLYFVDQRVDGTT